MARKRIDFFNWQLPSNRRYRFDFDLCLFVSKLVSSEKKFVVCCYSHFVVVMKLSGKVYIITL